MSNAPVETLCPRTLCVDKAMVDVRVQTLHQRDLAKVSVALPAAPYRTHRDDLEWQATREVTVLVAWLGDRPVGMGLIRWAGPREHAVAECLPKCPEIFRLEVLPGYRSMGVGTALIRRFEQLALERGWPCIGLGVGLENDGARRLYRRLGYECADAPVYVDCWAYPGPGGRRLTEQERCVFLVKRLRPTDNTAYDQQTCHRRFASC